MKDDKTRESEEAKNHLQEIFANANDIIVTLDLTGNLTSINKAAERITGYKKDDWIGKPFINIIAPEYRKIALKNFGIAMAGETVPTFEIEIIDKSGTRITLEINGHFLMQNDKIIGGFVIARDITEYKKIEKLLKESEERYRDLVEKSLVGVYIIQDGVFKYANKEFQNILGYSEEELIGADFKKFVVPEDMDWVVRGVSERQAGRGEPSRHELKAPRKDGKIIDIEVFSVPSVYQGIPAVQGMARDITKRKRIEKDLQESEERYRRIFEESPISIWKEDFSEIKAKIDSLKNSGVKDFRKYLESHPNTLLQLVQMVKVVDVNKATLELYKAKSKEQFLSGLGAIFVNESYDTFKEEIIALAEGKTRFESEAITQTLNGDKKYVALRLSVAPGYEETLSKIIVSIVDITDRKRMEEALRKSEEHFRSVAQTANDAIISVDNSGSIIFWNPAAEIMFGYSIDEVLGRPLTMILPERIRENFQKGFNNVISTGKGRSIGRTIETLGIRKDGTEFPVEVSHATWKTSEGVFFTGIIHDITRRKQAEMEINKYTSQLEASNKLKDLFIDIMHHDLLNPVGVVKNYSELLLDDEKDKGRREFLNVIEKNATKIIDMVESATKIAKLESQDGLVFEKKDLKKIFNEVADDLKHYADEKKMKLEYGFPKGECLAEVHDTINDVFSNLLSNAIKYSPKNSKIVIGIEDRGKEYLITVKDRGEGVPDEYKEEIFKRFVRADKKGVKGTGLGLAIVKRAVEMHNGKVWVEDNSGGGAIFCVSLKKKL